MNVFKKNTNKLSRSHPRSWGISAPLNLDLLGAVASQMESTVYPNSELATTLKGAQKVRDRAPRIVYICFNQYPPLLYIVTNFWLLIG